MSKVLRIAAAACVLALLLPSCATSTADMPEADKTRHYAGSYDDVWTAIQHAVSELKCMTVTTDKAGGSLQAKCIRSNFGKAMGEAPWGLYVSISQERGGVRVEANSEYLHPGAIGGGSESRVYVTRFFAAMDATLKPSVP